MLLHPLPRPRLHLLLPQARLPRAHRGIRDRVSRMWLRSVVGGFHYRPRDSRRGVCGHDVWRHGAYDQHASISEEAGLDGSYWRGDGRCVCCWAVAGWGVDD